MCKRPSYWVPAGVALWSGFSASSSVSRLAVWSEILAIYQDSSRKSSCFQYWSHPLILTSISSRICVSDIPRLRLVISFNLVLIRCLAFLVGRALVLLTPRQRLNPRNSIRVAATTRNFSWLTISFSFFSRKVDILLSTRSPARRLFTKMLQSSA